MTVAGASKATAVGIAAARGGVRAVLDALWCRCTRPPMCPSRGAVGGFGTGRLWLLTAPRLPAPRAATCLEP